jgi:hypothetical protein
MKRITIDGKEYVFEFSIAASLYNDLTEEIMNGFVKGGLVEDAAKNKNVKGAMEQFVSALANVPQRALTLFYAGLLEHHGTEYGDGSVKSMKDASKVLRAYLNEHKEEKLSFYDVMVQMMECIAEDNFFEMIGWEKMMENVPTEEPKKRRSRKDGETSSNE